MLKTTCYSFIATNTISLVFAERQQVWKKKHEFSLSSVIIFTVIRRNDAAEYALMEHFSLYQSGGKRISIEISIQNSS